MEKAFQTLPEDLHATVIAENDDFEFFVLEVDEMISLLGNKSNDQVLLVMPSPSRQILAFHVGKRDKIAGEALMAKLSIELKKSSPLHR